MLGFFCFFLEFPYVKIYLYLLPYKDIQIQGKQLKDIITVETYMIP